LIEYKQADPARQSSANGKETVLSAIASEEGPRQEGTVCKVAYLVNQYPHVSHSFIRREIVAVEAQGVAVERFSIRSSGSALVDASDQAEQKKTRVLLAAGPFGLLTALLGTFFTRPFRWLKALRVTIRLGRRSERGVLRHCIYLAEACVLRR